MGEITERVFDDNISIESPLINLTSMRERQLNFQIKRKMLNYHPEDA